MLGGHPELFARDSTCRDSLARVRRQDRWYMLDGQSFARDSTCRDSLASVRRQNSLYMLNSHSSETQAHA